MDDHLNEMMRLLNVDSNNVRIVGILGMGGIGKITIAKSIYNKLLQDFKNCCSFLADVRENVKQYKDKGIIDLQNQLLSDTLKPHPPITNVNRGIDAIKHRFLKKKVFIVLDNVDEKSQFDWLVGNRDCFSPGTRIIVTTRNKHVLNILDADETYEPPFMNPDQSLQLLNIHAFRKKFPPIDFDSISREVVSVTAGLPLALEVIGSFLSDKPKTVWENTLKKLKKIPNHKVQEKLREGGSIQRTPLFDGDNYAFWKPNMIAFLMTQVTKDGVIIEKEESEWTQAENNAQEGNIKALFSLFKYVVQSELARIAHCKIAKEAWDILPLTHEGTDEVKSSKIEMLVF
ncbi:disease resistance protein RUN1-like [Cornus florida]|uniref:disease resistance protein RUN1-like n=1 Tax=Cornus florida TaxID=4283 RepID=UPI0028A0E891|nr:disease resistance protein RUN1-like [Cornus florida]